jgi:hypothetical protein
VPLCRIDADSGHHLSVKRDNAEVVKARPAGRGALLLSPGRASSAAGSGGGGSGSSLPTAGGWSRETLTTVGIIFALLAILILAIVTPAPES